MEYFVQRMLDGPHHTSDSLDISSISRDPLKEINILNSPSSMHTFETFRKTKAVSIDPPPVSVAATAVPIASIITPTAPPPLQPPSVPLRTAADEKWSSNGDISLEKEIMAALNSCRLADKRRSMDIESILSMENINTTESHETDDTKETTRLIDIKSEDCVDHAILRNDNGYSLIPQLDPLNNNNDDADDDDKSDIGDMMDMIDGHDDESPLSPSELDGLLNHPSLELNGHSLLHTSTPVSNNNKPAIQPKPNMEKLKNSKNLVFIRTTTNDAAKNTSAVAALAGPMPAETFLSSPDNLHENDDVVMRSLSPCKPKDPAEMTLKERLALFERNTSEMIVVPRTPSVTNGSKRWTDKWLEQANRPTFSSALKQKNAIEMVPLHGKSYANRRTGSRDELSIRPSSKSYMAMERRTYSQELLGSPPASKLSERNRSNDEIDRILIRPQMPPPKVPERSSNKANIAALLTSTLSRHVEAKCSINVGRGRNDHSEMTAKLCEDSNNGISVIPIERNQPLPGNGLMRTTTVSRNGVRQPMVITGDIATTPTVSHQFGAHLNPANNGHNQEDKKEDERCDVLMECLLFFCCVG